MSKIHNYNGLYYIFSNKKRIFKPNLSLKPGWHWLVFVFSYIFTFSTPFFRHSLFLFLPLWCLQQRIFSFQLGQLPAQGVYFVLKLFVVFNYMYHFLVGLVQTLGGAVPAKEHSCNRRAGENGKQPIKEQNLSVFIYISLLNYDGERLVHHHSLACREFTLRGIWLPVTSTVNIAQNHKYQSHGGSSGEVRGSLKSVGFIIGETRTFVQNLLTSWRSWCV